MFRVLSLIFAGALAMTVHAETTITYQGQLEQAGTPLDGTPGMAFRLFDSPTDGNQIGETQSFTGVLVENGLFKVELNFGSGVFDGSERYLEVEVSATTLTPRQKITGAPVAQHALNVAAGAIDSDQIAPGAVGPTELATDSLTIASGTGLQGGGELPLGGSTTISIANGGVGTTQIAAGAVGADQADNNQIQLRITGNCEVGTVLVGVNSDGSVICDPLPLELVWQHDIGGDVGTHSDIAVRDNGLPIISYYDEANSNLKIFDCKDVICSSGVARTLDSDGSVGHHTAIAIRDNGQPIISYRDASNSSLKAFACADTTCSTGTAHTLDSDGSVGYFTAIDIGNDGNPIISHIRVDGLDSGYVKIFHCTDANCSSGNPQILDSVLMDIPTNTPDTAIAIREDGNPIISYPGSDPHQPNTEVLTFFRCTDPGCTEGDTGYRTIGTFVDSINMAIRDDSTAIISFRAFNSLGVVVCDENSCMSGLTLHQLDTNVDVGDASSMSIRDNGYPIISYRDDTNENLKLYDCQDADCSSGIARTIDIAGDVGQYSAIAIRDNNHPIISYRDDTNQTLKVYSCRNPDCIQ